MHLAKLVEQASRHFSTSEKGRQIAQPMDGFLLMRQDRVSSFDAALYEPVLCLILKGGKEVSIAGQSLSFGPGECLLVSHGVPVRSRVTRAPYLALVFKIDVAAIRKLHGDGSGFALDGESARVAETHRADPGLMDALHRYLAFAESPADAKVLGPLVAKEIHYRLLTAPFGGMLRRLIRRDSGASAIGRAMDHIRRNIRSPIEVPDLARQVGMSASSFHKHFKAIALTTPLQYQKELRLLEARQLLKMAGASVTAVAYDVGYESPSQFSREYVRKFGVPPSRDTEMAQGDSPRFGGY